MIKAQFDFELTQPLEKSAEETLDEIIEQLLYRARNDSGKEIQYLAKAVKDLAIARSVLSNVTSRLI